MIRKIDLLLVKGFISPFLVSFSIALFVLVMQTLWLYIDDIMGKGAGFFVIIEFLIYLSISLIPLALPIGVLLAGVFLFGNLGENYELSSMKSAGISLLRIMRPVIVIGALIAVLSWFCSDYLIPRSNLKFMSRLHDLKRQKPTLSLAEGVFNEDFYGYVIRIEKKSDDGMHIQGVEINDHSSPGEQTAIMARSGVMYVTPGDQFMVMQLVNGEMLQLPDRRNISGSRFPLVRSTFDTLTKVFSLKEFDLERTDEELFKGNQRMKNSSQLRLDIDSLELERSKLVVPIIQNTVVKSIASSSLDNILTGTGDDSGVKGGISYMLSKLNSRDSQTVAELVSRYEHPDTNQRLSNWRQAYGFYQSDQNSKESYKESHRSISVRKSKFIYELLIKYSYALICLVFIFVGAPLGAIVRKGGYGYPLLLCILVFVTYVLLNTFFKRLSESLAVSAVVGAWLPCLIVAIPGVFLSWSALRDRNFVHDVRLMLRWKFSRQSDSLRSVRRS